MLKQIKKWIGHDKVSPVRKSGWLRTFFIWDFIEFYIDEILKEKFPKYNNKHGLTSKESVARDKLYKKHYPRLVKIKKKCLHFSIWVERYIIDRLSYPMTYYRNAIRDKTHIIPTGLKKGGWYDSGNRLLHGIFTLVTNFVDVESKEQFNYYKERLEKGEIEDNLHDRMYRDILKVYNWYNIERPLLEKKIDDLYKEITYSNEEEEHIMAMFHTKNPLREEIHMDIDSINWQIEGKDKYYMVLTVGYADSLWD